MIEKTYIVCFVTTGCAAVNSLIHGFPLTSITGPDITFNELINGMLKSKKLVEVIVSEGEKCREDYKGLLIYHLGLVHGARRPFIFMDRMIKTIISIMKCDSPTIFHNEGLAGAVTFFSKMLGKNVIFGVASDAVVKPSMNIQVHGLKRLLNVFESWVNLNMSDVVVVQTESQALEVKNKYSRETILIWTSYEDVKSVNKKNEMNRVVWVGAIANIKQPWLYLELAKKLPNVEFLMIGGPSTDITLFNEIAMEAKNIPNLKMLGYIEPKRVNHYISDSALLINTSLLEGFPHTFVQAWAQSVPVVSLNADPDGLIEKKKMGFRAGSIGRMAELIAQLIDDKDLRMEMGENAMRHFLQEHDHDMIISKYIELFDRQTSQSS